MARTPRTPKYRHHKPSGQAVVTLGGHDCYLGKHDSEESHTEYRRRIAEWMAAGCTEPVQRSSMLSVAELLAGYWSHAVIYYRDEDGRPTSGIDCVRAAIGPVRSLYGDTLARDFGPAKLAAVRTHMVGLGWCRSTVNQRISAVRRVWSWGAELELVPAAVYGGLRGLRGLAQGRTEAPDYEAVPPAPEDALEAVRAAAHAMLRDLIDCQLLIGARPGEVCGLRGEWIDRSRAVWRVEIVRHKTRRKGGRRVLLVGPRAQEILAPRLLRHGAGWMWPSCEHPRGTRRQTPYLVGSYSQAVKRLCERLGVTHWHPHQLRHNAATRLVAQFGWDVARIILGHATIDATRIYAEDDLQKAAAAVQQVG